MLLDRRTYLIRERVGLLKFSDSYDIIDPENGQGIGFAKEKPGTLIHLLRLVINKQMLPTTVEIAEHENGAPLITIKRPLSLLRSKVRVLDATGTQLGYFVSKIFTFGGGFWVYSNDGAKVAEVKGDWKGWNFRFLDTEGKELGTVTKQWAGMAKELFTSADNYVVSLAESAPKGAGALLLAAGLAIDIIYKES